MTEVANPKYADLPDDVVRAWVAAGAKYGRLQIEWSWQADKPWSMDGTGDRSVVAPGYSDPDALPGFSFSRWDLSDDDDEEDDRQFGISPKRLAKLPIPDSPFGLTFRGCDACHLDRGALKALARFSDTLYELELWGQTSGGASKGDVTNEDLAALRPLSQLRALGICCTGYGLPVLQHLAALPRLETLRISQARNDEKVSDELRRISKFPSLHDLYLEIGSPTARNLDVVAKLDGIKSLRLDIRKLTQTGQRRLGKLRSLRFLRFGNSDLSDSILEDLAQLPHLEGLSIFNTNVTDSGMKALANARSLTQLQVSGTKITDEGAAHIAELPRLRFLDVGRTPIGDKGMREIGKAVGLRALRVGSTKVTDKGLKHFSRLKQLTHLEIGATDITGVGLRWLAKLDELRGLFMCGTDVTDEGLHHLTELKKLRSLDLRARMTGEGLAQLVGMRLNHLLVDQDVYTDTGVRNYLAVMPNTKRLDLQHSPVSNAGLRQLAKYPGLEYLNLWKTGVTDAGLKHLAKLPNLRWLDLQDLQVTDAGMDYLLRIPSLEYLNLTGYGSAHTGLTAAGFLKLAQHPSLRVLVITQEKYGGVLTESDIKKLRRAMPNCDIRDG